MSTSKLTAHQKHHRTVALEDDQGINYAGSVLKPKPKPWFSTKTEQKPKNRFCWKVQDDFEAALG